VYKSRYYLTTEGVKYSVDLKGSSFELTGILEFRSAKDHKLL